MFDKTRHFETSSEARQNRALRGGLVQWIIWLRLNGEKVSWFKLWSCALQNERSQPRQKLTYTPCMEYARACVWFTNGPVRPYSMGHL